MFKLVATDVPKTIEEFQLAIEAAFNAGKIVGENINLLNQNKTASLTEQSNVSIGSKV